VEGKFYTHSKYLALLEHEGQLNQHHRQGLGYLACSERNANLDTTLRIFQKCVIIK